MEFTKLFAALQGVLQTFTLLFHRLVIHTRSVLENLSIAKSTNNPLDTPHALDNRGPKSNYNLLATRKKLIVYE